DSVRQTSQTVEAPQLTLGTLITDEIRVRTWCGRARRCNLGHLATILRLLCGSPPLSACRERVGVSGKCHAEVLFYRSKYCEVHCLRITRCVDQHTAGGVFRRDFTKTLAQSLMETEVEPLEPICRGSCRGSGETGLDRQIEDQCQI